MVKIKYVNTDMCDMCHDKKGNTQIGIFPKSSIGYVITINFCDQCYIEFQKMVRKEKIIT